MKITVSVIKADVGGIGGHTKPSDGLLDSVRKSVKNAGDLLIDHYIGYCGDDIHIVMTHTKGAFGYHFFTLERAHWEVLSA